MVWTIYGFWSNDFLWQASADLQKVFSKNKIPFFKRTAGKLLNFQKNNVITAYNMKGRSRFYTFMF